VSVRFLDIAGPNRALREEIDAAVVRVVASGSYVAGAECAAFERELAAYLGVAHVIGVNSGTDALVLALKALGIGAGDDVVVPAYTFFATAEAVCLAGARPRFADCAADSFNVDVHGIERACTARTRAVMPVHLFGEPVDVAPIVDFCAARDLHLLEDTAQALGASHRGRRVGGFGAAGAFSFYPTKNLAACGDAGAIACNDLDLAARLRLLRNHARAGAEHAEIGCNSRLDEMQAAILRVKLPHLDAANERRRSIAARYRERLRDTRCVLPPIGDATDCSHVFHQFVVTHPQRDALRAYLAASEVEAAIYYATPCHLQPPFRADAPQLPVAERMAREAIALPIYPALSDHTVDRVAELVRAFERR